VSSAPDPLQTSLKSVLIWMMSIRPQKNNLEGGAGREKTVFFYKVCYIHVKVYTPTPTYFKHILVW